MIAMGLLALRLRLGPGLAILAAQVIVIATAAPLCTTLFQGQWNGLLLAMIVCAFVAGRCDRDRLAGVALGLAASFKLFPAVLLGWFALRGRWKTVVMGLMTFLTLQVAAMWALGLETFGDHLLALQAATPYRSGWTNASLPAFWARLFDPSSAWAIIPLVRAPILATALTLVSCTLIVALASRSAWRAGDRMAEDRSFAVALLAMLLLGPLTWEHTLLLALPVPFVAPPRPGYRRLMAGLALGGMWIAPLLLFTPLIRVHGGQLAAGPLGVLGAPSAGCYALMTLLVAVASDRDACPQLIKPDR